MNTEHQMKRMGQERPVPRFEIVYKPIADPPASGRWVEGAANPQPWHVRFIGANGEPVWWTESYADVRDAERAVELLAEAFAAGVGTVTVEETSS